MSADAAPCPHCEGTGWIVSQLHIQWRDYPCSYEERRAPCPQCRPQHQAQQPVIVIEPQERADEHEGPS